MRTWRFLAERILVKSIVCVAGAAEWSALPLLAKPLSRLLWLALPKRRAITVDNLKHALKCSEGEAEKLAQKVFH
ncbi:MAG: hypothetical protein ACK4I8_10385, partial [Armatimonadota bacterium]